MTGSSAAVAWTLTAAALVVVVWAAVNAPAGPEPRMVDSRLADRTPLESVSVGFPSRTCAPNNMETVRCEWDLTWAVNSNLTSMASLSLWAHPTDPALCPTACQWVSQHTISPGDDPTRTDRVTLTLPRYRGRVGLAAFVTGPGGEYVSAWTGMFEHSCPAS